ncbi:MAG: MoaD/ThiS family protein [Henriciella sp.]|nr:MoaD/ThiS family protein [Henriciella sp.]
MAHFLFFGKLADITGAMSVEQPLPDTVTDTSTLRSWLDETYQASGALLETTVRLAINSEIVAEPAPVREHDEIALMPPVGGG